MIPGRRCDNPNREFSKNLYTFVLDMHFYDMHSYNTDWFVALSLVPFIRIIIQVYNRFVFNICCNPRQYISFDKCMPSGFQQWARIERKLVFFKWECFFPRRLNTVPSYINLVWYQIAKYQYLFEAVQLIKVRLQIPSEGKQNKWGVFQT